MNYSAVLRVVMEVLDKQTEDEEGELPEGQTEANSLRNKLKEIHQECGEMRVLIDWPNV